jgi:hypothetical protein
MSAAHRQDRMLRVGHLLTVFIELGYPSAGLS